MAGEMMGGGPPMQAAAGAAPAPEPPPNDAGDEKPLVFLSAETLGGRKVKAGDTLNLTIIDVDPETGDVSADLAGGGGGGEMTSEAPGGYADDFDKAMPEEA